MSSSRDRLEGMQYICADSGDVSIGQTAQENVQLLGFTPCNSLIPAIQIYIFYINIVQLKLVRSSLHDILR